MFFHWHDYSDSQLFQRPALRCFPIERKFDSSIEPESVILNAAFEIVYTNLVCINGVIDFLWLIMLRIQGSVYQWLLEPLLM